MKQLLVLLILSQLAIGQETKPDNQLLWEITGNELAKPSYLFGSFHSNDKRLFKMADSIFLAMDQSETIALETDIFSLFNTWDTRKESIQLSYDKHGQPYVYSAEATETYYGNENGMPQFLDAFFQQYCYNAGKIFAPLETVDSQLNIWDDLDLLDLSGMRIETLLTNQEDLLETYLEGDIYSLDEILRGSLSFYKGSYESLITDRNFGMADKLDSLLKLERSVFCAIGAGHLPGSSGVINLLRNKGYSLRKVTASYSEGFDVKQSVFDHKMYEFHNDTIGFTAIFPGKPAEVRDDLNEFKFKLIYREYGQGNTYAIEIFDLWNGASIEELAEQYIASPPQSPKRKIQMDSGQIAYEGIADSYPDGVYWARLIMNDRYFMVIKAFGGNKFMNSKRAHHFFDKVWFD